MELVRRRPHAIWMWTCLTLLLFFGSICSFYLPCVAPQDFTKRLEIETLLHTLWTALRILGKFFGVIVLRILHMWFAALLFKMRESQVCNVACRVILKAKEAKEFKEKIEDEYRVNMILDNLPLVMPFKAPELNSVVYEHGFLVGLKRQYSGKTEQKYFIHNHLAFTVKYHKDEETDAARIVGFELKPFSVKPEYDGKWDAKTRLKTCDPRAKRTADSPLQVEESSEIIFTYDVDIQESEVKWAFWMRCLSFHG